MAWIPKHPEPPEPDKSTQPTLVTTAADDDPTRVHRPPGDDDPTIARQPAIRPGQAERDPDTVNDDDPTVNRKALSKTVPAAELLDQRYQLLGQLGAGGMGEVWRARHVQLARDVAIKFLTNEEGGPRFRLEAQAIAAIHHTGVVNVLDFGETGQGVPYFVMELIEGETLSARVRRQGPLSWALVRNIALEISDALAHAHQVGVIHRDLKPSNVIVLESPPPRGSSSKLIDFGIAKLLDDGKPKITKAGYIQGTPAYMSPEQVLAEPVDVRADVYGLGCLLYFMLAGRRPFFDKTGTAALRAQVYEELPRFEAIVPGLGIPPDVESIVFRALAKDKTARFQTMRELHEAILAIPPDAGASLSKPRPPLRFEPGRGSDSVESTLRTTASYSAGYAALNEADAAEQSVANLVGSAASSSSGALSHASSSSSSGASSVVLVLAIVGSLLLVAAAVAALIWALTST